MLPKKCIVFPNGENLESYSRAIAYALKSELGTSHQAVKIVRKWTGAGERTVKNWLAGINGPSGQHLVDLIRHSDDVLTVLLILAGRRQVVAAQRIVDVRNQLAETVERIDAMMGEGNPAQLAQSGENSDGAGGDVGSPSNERSAK